ncbi:hypothetical protein PN462_10450 [Spirulina sp. CS-785/01]|uniref:hypothetical protein n=1 Tax=Spirulina sp. CS-785/01 TaxID=3021716 RepID=UPI00232E1D1E|nr:hypothetical protein [Spirulina sp. CS-785/01]MDB9313519.1 hypothetical protein [Spirulina sp. CS-785/01]
MTKPIVSLFHKVPILSLSILFLIYSVFGWLISIATPEWLECLYHLTGEPSENSWLMLLLSRWMLWTLAACLIILLALIFTAPSSLIRSLFTSLIQSDSRAFLSVILLAFAAVVFITWIHHFVRFVVLLAAGALARLELQGADCGEWQSFGILCLVSLGGFAVGVSFHEWLDPSEPFMQIVFLN